MGEVKWVKINPLTHYNDWLHFRSKQGIGASEAPVVVGADNYKSNLQLYYEKIGMDDNSFESLATEAGIEQEPIIAKWYCYYSGTPQSIVQNLRNGNKVAEVEDCKASVYDTDYPFLFASPDRIILKNRTHNSKGALECKSTQRAIIDMYESKMVPSHLIQNLIQIHIPKFSHGEIAYFLDNKTFSVVSIHNPMDYFGTFEAVREQCRVFWETIKTGRAIYTEYYDALINQNKRKAQKLMADIEGNEPPPQNTKVYLDYLTKRFKNRLNRTGIKKGDTSLYNHAKRHAELKKEIKDLSQKLIAEEIIIKNSMKDAEQIEFDDKSMGSIRLVKSTDNKIILYNNIK
jgi:predicted phage-related endonuclease